MSQLNAMNFYEVIIIGQKAPILTYQSIDKLQEYQLVLVSLKSKERKGIIIRMVNQPSFDCHDIEKIFSFVFSKKYQKIISFISTYYVSEIAKVLAIFTTMPSTIIEKEQKVTTKVVLSTKQQKCFEDIKKHNCSLLFGDTGSGKTEIYIQLIEECINSGKNAILLLPEISLTPQIKKRLTKQFGSLLAMWHSKLSKKSKTKILENICSGDVKIIAGARSALFLPNDNIGLIIVDEEHDDSYKSSTNPKYNARDMAVYIAKVLGAKVLVASATPSISSYIKHPIIRLKGTYHSSNKTIEFINSSDELPNRIFEEIKITKDQGNQAIIFVPTRANFKYLICKNCGESFKCPFCDVGMSVHSYKHILKCHYCSFTTPQNAQCDCGTNEFVSHRVGTHEVINELIKTFPDTIIEKFDRDSITTNSKLKDILNKFQDKEIDVLVGTQMLSKGHDYHNVSLAIILGIDFILNSSDYRAREKAMSLFLQVAGRAGRMGNGRVIVQSSNKDFFENYLEDYELFLQDEKLFRDPLYPPFCKFVKFSVVHLNQQKAYTDFLQLQKCIKKSGMQVVGDGQEKVFKVSNKFRYFCLIREFNINKLLKHTHYCKTSLVDIDIDPVSI